MFKNANETFKSGTILAHDVEINVETSTMFSVNGRGKPVKATNDVVYVKLFDNNEENELNVILEKEAALNLIAALATATSKLRNEIK